MNKSTLEFFILYNIPFIESNNSIGYITLFSRKKYFHAYMKRAIVQHIDKNSSTDYSNLLLALK